ncbi:DUF3857 domain-containing protein [Deminuibacter soli]|uniref:DUF3857 domain-containing protein n=1 Tax=Deminuibacter soli TaxID=2291815 RepID=A0A3E1NEX4_9BACT|nr:DUF3857 domain-containing protein [Deminuibacter soli]RFM26535.1 DUF3857 domain-containing protein [Deminuibacter soli]
MKRLLFLLLVVPFYLQAQQYNISLIPDSLTKNANAVVRMDETSVVIKSSGHAVVTHKYAVTILNEEGNRFAVYSNDYDKLHSLRDISGHLFDANGKQLRSVKSKDIADESDNDFSLATDSRVKSHNFYWRIYPYTVEYEDEQEYYTMFNLPYWMPVNAEHLAVQQSRFTVEAPAGFKLHYKAFNYAAAPQTTANDKTTVLSWQLNNVQPVEREYLSPAWQELTTAVYLAAETFSLNQYEGHMDSWQSLGSFMGSLYAGRDELPDNVKQDVHRLADGLGTQKEKIKVLYKYMQQNTRYISVQLGIGGWQPFDAKFVAAKRYGDCKALSNYMKALLKEAGIEGNCVIISSGRNVNKGLWEDFPANYFNHVILCVPVAKDTTWLECTSQTMAPGFLGNFTDARQALLLAADGGHVVWTPRYTAKDNQQLRSVQAQINEEGNLVADVHTEFTGLQEEERHMLMYDVSKDDREKYLNETLNLPTYKVEQMDFKEQEADIPKVNETLRISAPGYATVSGKRMFIEANLFNKSGRLPAATQPRRYDIEFRSSFRDEDSVHIAIPAGYKAESMPQDVHLAKGFGSYTIHFEIKGNTIVLYRSLERIAGRYPASLYPEFAKFYADMYAADRKRIVLVKE